LPRSILYSELIITTHSVKTFFLLDIYLYDFNSNIFISNWLPISANAYVDVISGGLWQLLVEPWRIVEGAACALRPTTSTIPQRVVSIEDKTSISCVACITEVVIAYECWRGSSALSTGVVTGTVTTDFITCSCKCPDVLVLGNHV
jgi:hypothetical protein